MPVTVTDVATPNAAQTYGTLGHYKTRTVNVQFDNSYVTTGEVITAAQLGFTTLVGGIVVVPAKNAAGTLAMPVMVVPNTAQTQAALQLLRYDGAAAGKASLEEAANAFDASTFTAQIMFLGY